jgi:low affinity Fe/Cu permease
MSRIFAKLAEVVARLTGTPWAFASAAALIVGWALVGPAFGFSDTWQLVVNTATTIVTFLMVFLIQNTQNRDNAALHAKLDDLILITHGADNKLIGSEQRSDAEIERMRSHIEELGRSAGRNGSPKAAHSRKRRKSAAKR